MQSTWAVKELSKPDDGISFSEKQMSQTTLASKNGPRIVQGRGSTSLLRSRY